MHLRKFNHLYNGSIVLKRKRVSRIYKNLYLSNNKMIQNHFVADNSRFGVVLTRVMAEHGISTRRFTALCGVKTQRVCDLKKAMATIA